MCQPAILEPGKYPVEPLPQGWENVRAEREGKRSRIEILDPQGINRYLQEPMGVVAGKLFWISLVVIPYLVLYTAVQGARLLIVPIANLSLPLFFRQIWKIGSIPYYGIGMQFSALYGVFNPLEGRALFADWERGLHGASSRKEAIQHQTESPGAATFFWNALSPDSPSLFLGYCMQPVGVKGAPGVTLFPILLPDRQSAAAS